MRNVKFPDIPGVVQNVGGSQGYVPISVKYGRIAYGRTASMLYQPSPGELETLNQGGKIRLTLVIGDGLVQPHLLEVQE